MFGFFFAFVSTHGLFFELFIVVVLTSYCTFLDISLWLLLFNALHFSCKILFNICVDSVRESSEVNE